jgi:hypothetical protein
MLKNDTPASPATALASKVLPVPGGPYQQYTLGNSRPNLGKALWSFQKLNNLDQFSFCLFNSRYILESCFG